MTPIEFIEHLRGENEAFYGDERGRGALKDLQVVFPVPWIYLAELVQNAIDAAATRIRFAPDDSGGLLFEHNGKSFSREDVRALCMRGVSTKSTNTVGFMGVGFKSVFKAYETVVVSSGDWQFQLSVPSDETFGARSWIGAVLPTWAPDAEKPSDGCSCRFQFNQRLIDGTPDGDLAELLRDGEALVPLLGWNRVTSLEVGDSSWQLTTTETAIDGGDASRVRVEAASLDRSKRSWLLFVKSYQPSEAAVLRFLRHRQIQPSPDERESVLSRAKRLREVSLFCELSADGSPLPVHRGQCFSLVPTGQTTCLGMHLQADWLLDISRREPMRIANDPWQQEILEQVPFLLSAYLDWLVSEETEGAQSWSDGYGAVPGETENTEIDAALHGGSVARMLCSLLVGSRFIPCDADEGKVSFVTPAKARLLPEALKRGVAGDQALSVRVFGSTIVDTGTLGLRALTFLKRNNLLRSLTPDELKEKWESGKLGTWYKHGGDAPDPRYVRLIAGLAELDSGTAWATADLRCLPAADGVWRSRRDLKRYPPNWTILGPSPRVAATLEGFVGVSSELLDWKTDQTLRRDAAAQQYLQPLPETTLEQVASNWWASLAEEPDQATRELVIEFTELVRRQKTLPRLVGKALAMREDGERLLPIDQVLLADPYAGKYRRLLFPKLPTVSPVYLASSRDATDADWRTFFEEQKPSPRGRPTLMLSHRRATAVDLSFLSAIPGLRTTYVQCTWSGISIDSNAHYVIDAQWPAGITPVESNASAAHSMALQRSMVEMPGLLRSWRQPRIAYISPRSSDVSFVTLPADAAWLVVLRERPWLFDKADGGPYRVTDILAGSDASRPDAPVAKLADGFAALAGELGITFGATIPNAPAIERLRTLGVSASWSELHDLLQNAISEAADDSERLALLQSVLTNTSLFALPQGRQAPDGLRRVTGSRVVAGGRRSTLGDWVCSVDSFPDDGPEVEVFKQVSAALEIAGSTTGEHAAAFLHWVWSKEPDADTVRQILPRAFQYALELPEETKAELRAPAKVFVTARRWASVCDGNVFLNDLEIADRDLVAADQEAVLPRRVTLAMMTR